MPRTRKGDRNRALVPLAANRPIACPVRRLTRASRKAKWRAMNLDQMERLTAAPV